MLLTSALVALVLTANAALATSEPTPAPQRMIPIPHLQRRLKPEEKCVECPARLMTCNPPCGPSATCTSLDVSPSCGRCPRAFCQPVVTIPPPALPYTVEATYTETTETDTETDTEIATETDDAWSAAWTDSWTWTEDTETETDTFEYGTDLEMATFIVDTPTPTDAATSIIDTPTPTPVDTDVAPVPLSPLALNRAESTAATASTATGQTSCIPCPPAGVCNLMCMQAPQGRPAAPSRFRSDPLADPDTARLLRALQTAESLVLRANMKKTDARTRHRRRTAGGYNDGYLHHGSSHVLQGRMSHPSVSYLPTPQVAGVALNGSSTYVPIEFGGGARRLAHEAVLGVDRDGATTGKVANRWSGDRRGLHKGRGRSLDRRTPAIPLNAHYRRGLIPAQLLADAAAAAGVPSERHPPTRTTLDCTTTPYDSAFDEPPTFYGDDELDALMKNGGAVDGGSSDGMDEVPCRDGEDSRRKPKSRSRSRSRAGREYKAWATSRAERPDGGVAWGTLSASTNNSGARDHAVTADLHAREVSTGGILAAHPDIYPSWWGHREHQPSMRGGSIGPGSGRGRGPAGAVELERHGRPLTAPKEVVARPRSISVDERRSGIRRTERYRGGEGGIEDLEDNDGGGLQWPGNLGEMRRTIDAAGAISWSCTC
ncbi:hypothetical protein HK101_003762 [Irineochytrium annulatum]|nr:hypothetical protein HK101_003762 [Irineochytrium annulatum]